MATRSTATLPRSIEPRQRAVRIDRPAVRSGGRRRLRTAKRLSPGLVASRLGELVRQPGFIVAFLFGAQVVLYTQTVAYEGHLERERRVLQTESEANVRLGAELSSLRALDRIQDRASQLGLVSPGIVAYLPSPAPGQAPRPLSPLSLGAAAAY